MAVVIVIPLCFVAFPVLLLLGVFVVMVGVAGALSPQGLVIMVSVVVPGGVVAVSSEGGVGISYKPILTMIIAMIIVDVVGSILTWHIINRSYDDGGFPHILLPYCLNILLFLFLLHHVLLHVYHNIQGGQHVLDPRLFPLLLHLLQDVQGFRPVYVLHVADQVGDLRLFGGLAHFFYCLLGVRFLHDLLLFLRGLFRLIMVVVDIVHLGVIRFME